MWKDVVGFEGFYMVSDKGEVYSIRRKITLKQTLDENGYPKVNLSANGNRRNVKTHRLVAEAFIPNTHNFPAVNHIDENKQNNHVYNLEWCTIAYNNAYGSRMEKIKAVISKGIIMYDLKGNFIKKYEYLKDVANDGYTMSSVSSCARGNYKQHKNRIFIYSTEDQEVAIKEKLNSLKRTRHKPHGRPYIRSVGQFSLDGQLLNTFKTILEASKFGNFNHGAISQCCNGRAKTHKGYVWKFI